MKNDERKGKMEDEETSSFNILHSYFPGGCCVGHPGLNRIQDSMLPGMGNPEPFSANIAHGGLTPNRSPGFFCSEFWAFSHDVGVLFE